MPPPDVQRFGRVERAVHWTNAALVLFLLASGFNLYGTSWLRFVGNRATVKDLHAWAGYLLPIPVVLGSIGRAGRQFREDLRRFSRWTADDKLWWSTEARRHAHLGKFNPGQKLNAVFVGACIIVFLATGIVLRWHERFPLWQRTGADFTHRWFSIVLAIVTVGHILMAMFRPQAMRGIIQGRVRSSWASAHHPRWYAEVSDPEASTPDDAEANLRS